MHTREDYMEHKCSHEEYYGQFVSERTIAYVVLMIGADRLVNSIDPHFNDVPLARWDRIANGVPLAAKFGDAGDYPTLCGLVCVAKQAARQYVNGKKV